MTNVALAVPRSVSVFSGLRYEHKGWCECREIAVAESDFSNVGTRLRLCLRVTNGVSSVPQYVLYN